jgi:hypothetical protein
LKSQASREAPPQQQQKPEPQPAGWFQRRADRIAALWLAEVRARDARQGGKRDQLLEQFFTLLSWMLPSSFGPYREQIEPLWAQTAELFGSVAARRGLAAGEAVDEFQILREVLIRELYTDPPGGSPLSLRDALQLNRFIDRGIAQASIGHADALFFALFRGSGVPESLEPEVTREVTAQLDAIREEFRSTMALLEG